MLFQISEEDLKIHKIFEDGIEYTKNIPLSTGKKEEDSAQISDKLKEIEEKAKDVDKKFDEILKNTIEQTNLPRHLHAMLEKQKAQVQEILGTYDSIISNLNNDLNEKDKKYREKMALYNDQDEIIRKRIENLITELNRVGKEEISSLRKKIVCQSQGVAEKLFQKNDNFLNEEQADKPFDSYLWKTPSDMLSPKQLEDAFYLDQKDSFKLRKSFLTEICKLRNQLEIEKLEYNLQREEIEKQIFYLKEKCLKEKCCLAKVKNKCIRLRDERKKLLKQLDCLENEIKVQKANINIYQKAITADSYNCKKAYSIKYNLAFDSRCKDILDKKTEIYQALDVIFKTVFETNTNENLNTLKKMDMKTSKDWTDFLELISKMGYLDDACVMLDSYSHDLRRRNQLKKNKKYLSLCAEEYLLCLNVYHSKT